MSGYASADVLGAEEPHAEPHPSPGRDPLSGYASADLIERRENDDER